MNSKNFIEQKVKEIKDKVENEKALLALSGGVDSSVVAIIVHKALDKNLISYFIDDYFRKKEEDAFVRDTFARLGIEVQCCDIQEKMLAALAGVSDNSEKRPIFKDVFYGTFGELVKQSSARYLLQGTIKADLKMYEKGQLQHNVGIPFQDFGIEQAVEPLTELYKPGVREVAKLLGLPKEISERATFPGPGLLIRCLGEVKREKVDLIREGLAIAEEELDEYDPFQVVVAVSSDLVCSMIDRAMPDKYMLIVRAVKSKDQFIEPYQN